MPSDAIEPPFISDVLVLCDDPECSVAWAYSDPPVDHWHPRPHGPREPGPNYHCVICDEPGAILCETHR